MDEFMVDYISNSYNMTISQYIDLNARTITYVIAFILNGLCQIVFTKKDNLSPLGYMAPYYCHIFYTRVECKVYVVPLLFL